MKSTFTLLYATIMISGLVSTIQDSKASNFEKCEVGPATEDMSAQEKKLHQIKVDNCRNYNELASHALVEMGKSTANSDSEEYKRLRQQSNDATRRCAWPGKRMQLDLKDSTDYLATPDCTAALKTLRTTLTAFMKAGPVQNSKQATASPSRKVVVLKLGSRR